MENVNLQKIEKSPSVLNYADYRVFLRVAVPAVMQEYGLSLRRFVANCGLSSTSFLQSVIKGEKNILENTANRIATALGLSDLESKYFVNLVALNQAKTSSQIQLAHAALVEYQRSFSKKTITNAESVLFTRPEVMILFELMLQNESISSLHHRAHFLDLSLIELEAILNDLQSEELISISGNQITKLTHYLDLQELQGNGALIQYHQKVLRYLLTKMSTQSFDLSASIALALTSAEHEQILNELKKLINNIHLKKSHTSTEPVAYLMSLHLMPTNF